MSMVGLLLGTREHLKDRLGLTDKFITIQEDGQPEPFVGDFIYVVHPTGWGALRDEPNDTLEERFDLSVSVTQRTPRMPLDRRMESAYLKAMTGLEARCRAIMLAVHLSYDVVSRANELMQGDFKIVEPFRWIGTDPFPRKVDGTWFWAEPDQASGMVMEVRFGKAARYQRIIKAGTQDTLE